MVMNSPPDADDDADALHMVLNPQIESEARLHDVYGALRGPSS